MHNPSGLAHHPYLSPYTCGILTGRLSATPDVAIQHNQRGLTINTSLDADQIQEIFDALPDTVFFMKDVEGRYTHVNLTLVRRLGMKNRSDLLGRTVTQLFPDRLSSSYKNQDDRVLRGGSIQNHLETHLYVNRAPGWCLTIKNALYSGERVVGLVGISRDLGMPDSRHSSFKLLQRAIDYMQNNFGSSLRVQTLADIAGVSVAQLERLFKRVFQLTPQQMLTKTRIEDAMRLLNTDMSIAEISQVCGYSDQSAFARQFKATVSMSPRDYRGLVR